MKNPSTVAERRGSLRRDLLTHQPDLLRQGILRLLRIKDSDVRLLTLEQAREAIDKSLHSGGAFSATIPLVTLYYGGFMKLDIVDPTRRGQDMFTLSKGHAVAAMASIYADLGYFDRSVLKNSRSHASILNGHPGPILPGVHIATGPMGQGMGVAQGFAIAGRTQSPRFDSYAICGDGEMQEGPIWESVMYAGATHLDNLCVMVDRNYGQLDIHNRMVFPMPDLAAVFASFGWNAHSIDTTDYEGIYSALEAFKFGPRNGKPTAIICNSTKGYGSQSDFMNKHKVTIPDALIAQEVHLQTEARTARVAEFTEYADSLEGSSEGDALREILLDMAKDMHLDIARAGGRWTVNSVVGPVLTRRVPVRDKQIKYDPNALPKLDAKKQYSAAEIVTSGMKVFAKDTRVVSIDSDLASTSGLEAGVGAADQKRALNVGVAEANMMLIGEAFAALGDNAWVSTFCPFFDWKVLRRIAVGHQERLEAEEAKDGWLSKGHGLDLTFLATAANFETRTNGATHMGNDDNLTFEAVAHLQIIDVSCPQQMLSIMKWIMDGNKGLNYVRVMRTPSAVLYGQDYVFEYGKGYIVKETPNDTVAIISSGRQVHESLAAAEKLATAGIHATVVDMPSIDDDLLVKLYESGKKLVFAEQNNGFIWQNFLKAIYRKRDRVSKGSLKNVMTINTLDTHGRAHFIHSATYEELVVVYGLTPDAVAKKIQEFV